MNADYWLAIIKKVADDRVSAIETIMLGTVQSVDSQGLVTVREDNSLEDPATIIGEVKVAALHILSLDTDIELNAGDEGLLVSCKYDFDDNREAVTDNVFGANGLFFIPMGFKKNNSAKTVLKVSTQKNIVSIKNTQSLYEAEFSDDRVYLKKGNLEIELKGDKVSIKTSGMDLKKLFEDVIDKIDSLGDNIKIDVATAVDSLGKPAVPSNGWASLIAFKQTIPVLKQEVELLLY